MSTETIHIPGVDDQTLAALNARYGGIPPERLLPAVTAEFGAEQVAFANSFGLEDVVIGHHLLALTPAPRTFVLDTGYLPAETYALIDHWRGLYAQDIAIFRPEAAEVLAYAAAHGADGFRRSVDLRRQCCAIRKLAPMARALAGKRAWISGLRRQQSEGRAHAELFERDQWGLIKINPLLDWSLEQVWTYVRRHDVPYNRLHDHGYPSIGCAPCTRAVAVGEHPRSGRWWWETQEHRECGLHNRPNQEQNHA